MKNKEESVSDLSRGSPSSTEETNDSIARPGDTAAASLTRPALSLFPESLIEAVVDEGNMESAWANVRKNRGAPGPDGVTIAEFPEWFRPRWPDIRRQLLDGTYKPSPVRRVEIEKPDGGTRSLGIPNVIDRVIQQAIVQILTPIFDPEFSESSFGFRPGRSAHGAAKGVQKIIRQGYRHAIDMDLSKFFDRVQHDVLMCRIGRKVSDKLLLRLIGRFLRAGVLVDGVLYTTTEGTPQGGPASPLLANILLDDLDKELERRGLKFVRYADDITIFVKSRRSAERVYASVVRYLTDRLRLVVNQEKSRIVASDGVEFLGFVFRGRKATINVSDKSIHRFKHRVRTLTGRSWGVSMERRLSELRSYLRGWIGYYGLAAQLKLFDRFDQWIRRRIRMCYWKRWRLARTRRRELIRMGVPRRQAIRHARSRKGHWHMSKTIASGVGMTNQWLADQGLIYLKPLWSELAPLRRTA